MAGTLKEFKIHGESLDLTSLYDFADKLVAIYQGKLMETDENGHKAAYDTGALHKAVPHYTIEKGVGGNGYVLDIVLHLPDHWYYVEEGRNPTTKGQGGILYPIIKAWVDRHNIEPDPMKFGREHTITRGPRKGQVYNPREAFAKYLTHAIHKEGFYVDGSHSKPAWVNEGGRWVDRGTVKPHHGKHLLAGSLEEAKQKGFIDTLIEKFTEALAHDVSVEISEVGFGTGSGRMKSALLK